MKRTRNIHRHYSKKRDVFISKDPNECTQNTFTGLYIHTLTQNKFARKKLTYTNSQGNIHWLDAILQVIDCLGLRTQTFTSESRG